MGIAISTLGFLSQGMLTAPRVYYAMARDGLFFESVGRLERAHRRAGDRHRAARHRCHGDRVLRQVRADSQLRSVGGLHLVRPRRRRALPASAARSAGRGQIYRAPGHPYTTALFVAACVGIVASTVITDPLNSARGWGILLTGVPVYWYWSRRRKAR